MLSKNITPVLGNLALLLGNAGDGQGPSLMGPWQSPQKFQNVALCPLRKLFIPVVFISFLFVLIFISSRNEHIMDQFTQSLHTSIKNMLEEFFLLCIEINDENNFHLI